MLFFVSNFPEFINIEKIQPTYLSMSMIIRIDMVVILFVLEILFVAKFTVKTFF